MSSSKDIKFIDNRRSNSSSFGQKRIFKTETNTFLLLKTVSLSSNYKKKFHVGKCNELKKNFHAENENVEYHAYVSRY